MQYCCLNTTKFVSVSQPVYRAMLVAEPVETVQPPAPWACDSECYPSAFNATEYHCANCYRPSARMLAARPPIFEPEVMCGIIAQWHGMQGLFPFASTTPFVCEASAIDVLLAWMLRAETWHVNPASFFLLSLSALLLCVQIRELYGVAMYEKQRAKQAQEDKEAERAKVELAALRDALPSAGSCAVDDANLFVAESVMRQRKVN